MSDLSDRDDLAETLRSMTPSGGRLRHDRVVFEAGRAKGHHESRIWVGLSVFFGMLTICLIAWLALEPRREIRITAPVFAPPPLAEFIPEEMPSSPSPPLRATNPLSGPDLDAIRQAWAIRHDVLEGGADKLPAPRPVPMTTAIVREAPPSTEAEEPFDIAPRFGVPSGPIFLTPR